STAGGRRAALAATCRHRSRAYPHTHWKTNSYDSNPCPFSAESRYKANQGGVRHWTAYSRRRKTLEGAGIVADVRFAPESGQIADCLGRSALWPEPTYAAQQIWSLLDYLVGAAEQ